MSTTANFANVIELLGLVVTDLAQAFRCDDSSDANAEAAMEAFARAAGLLIEAASPHASHAERETAQAIEPLVRIANELFQHPFPELDEILQA